MRVLFVVVVGLGCLGFLPRGEGAAVKPYVPTWKTHESQARQISDEFAVRYDRDLHTRVCEAR